jgi:hypothetical protein
LHFDPEIDTVDFAVAVRAEPSARLNKIGEIVEVRA